MKLFNKCLVLCSACWLMAATSCKDYLKEVSVSNTTSDSYFPTAEGYEDLVRACYPLLRGITQQRDLVLQGTDVFTHLYWSGGGDVQNALNGYDATMNSSLAQLQLLWDALYKEIGRCNTAIDRAAQVEDMDPALLEVRQAEAKFLRAYCYFHLVQQWGDVPLRLTETVSASKESVRAPSADIYTQILKDLQEAEASLPETASDYGRATKGAARFLLARVYLTRGWNFQNALGGTAQDFQKALEYADQVIEAYPLAARYSDLFPHHNENPLLQGNPSQYDENPEIVFAVQYSDNIMTNTNPLGNAEPGNDAHSIFGGQVESIPGNLGRTNDYNRNQEKQIVTPAMYRLFDPELDTRYHWDFVDAQYALKPVPDFHPVSGNPTVTMDIQMGDTVLLFRPWNHPATDAEKGIDVGGTRPYAVYNVTDFCLGGKATPFNSPYIHPLMWKFWQPGIDYGDAYGTLDQPLFRSAEAYLIAAEAILKGATGGKLGGADVYYNRVLDRALGDHAGATPYCAQEPGELTSLDSTGYRATPGNLSIDMVLDERARELMGENVRWYDLKRTGKLIERASRMNPWTRLISDIQTYHLLRPIPQGEIDLSSTSIDQNDGY